MKDNGNDNGNNNVNDNLNGNQDPENLQPEKEAAEKSPEEQIAILADQLLRNQADMENLRKRMSREMDKARSFAIENFARDLLPVLDNMNRVLATLAENSDSGLKDGVRLILRETQAVLARHHVVRIEAAGQMFDPNLHEALFENPDPSKPAGTITQIIEDGYMIGDRLLRAARVGVVSAPAAPDNDEGDDVDDEEQASKTPENGPKRP